MGKFLQLVEPFDEPNQASAKIDEEIAQEETNKKPKQAEIFSTEIANTVFACPLSDP